MSSPVQVPSSVRTTSPVRNGLVVASTPGAVTLTGMAGGAGYWYSTSAPIASVQTAGLGSDEPMFTFVAMNDAVVQRPPEGRVLNVFPANWTVPGPPEGSKFQASALV